MTTTTLRLFAACAFMFACTAHADCAFPKAPTSIPDGKTATEEQMLAAMNAFKAYNEEVKGYAKCLEDESKNKVGGSMQLKAMQTKKLNAAMEELQANAKLFNEEVRIYKAR
jgi:hypothetical protein